MSHNQRDTSCLPQHKISHFRFNETVDSGQTLLTYIIKKKRESERERPSQNDLGQSKMEILAPCLGVWMAPTWKVREIFIFNLGTFYTPSPVEFDHVFVFCFFKFLGQSLGQLFPPATQV